MEDIVCVPGTRNVQAVGSGTDALKDLVGTETFGGELLGQGICAEVVRLQPYAISNSEVKVLAVAVGIMLVSLLCLFNGKLTTGLHLIDVLEAEREIEDLFRGRAVRVHWVVAIVRIEGGHANGWVVMVVVGKLSCVEEIDPIILAVRREHAEICLEPLVVRLDLALGLWVVGSGEALVDTKGAIQATHIWSSELRATVGVVMQGESMEGPYTLDVELSELFSGAGGFAGDEVGHLRETVGNDINGIKTTGQGQFDDKVRLGP